MLMEKFTNELYRNKKIQIAILENANGITLSG